MKTNKQTNKQSRYTLARMSLDYSFSQQIYLYFLEEHITQCSLAEIDSYWQLS